MSDQNNIEPFIRRRAMRPSRRTWIKHAALLLITIITCTVAGIIYPFGPLLFFDGLDSDTTLSATQIIFSLPNEYGKLIASAVTLLFTKPDVFQYGISFSLSVLFILTSHEAGHYIACRIYGVDATLPYFLPTPPLIGPAGTLGAFIKIVSPMPSRRAVFDIGVAGPIAGFIALIPIALIAVFTMHSAPAVTIRPDDVQLVFADPLLMRLFAFIAGLDLAAPVYSNPFYNAAWVGFLVTALNLIPSGQLDGGHAVYAALGERVHYWTGRVAFVLMALLSVAGLYFYGSPSGFLFAVILAIMMRIRHPEPFDNTPLDPKRKVIAVLTLLIFLLCFMPFPIQLR
ncbi:MAG: site-2 protease family protein [Acidobacteria bacterium]|nr:site-2 protease family protein [Acidobacteriota bacterium]